MILQGVRHPISCLRVCYANNPQKGGCTGSRLRLIYQPLFEVSLSVNPLGSEGTEAECWRSASNIGRGGGSGGGSGVQGGLPPSSDGVLPFQYIPAYPSRLPPAACPCPCPLPPHLVQAAWGTISPKIVMKAVDKIMPNSPEVMSAKRMERRELTTTFPCAAGGGGDVSRMAGQRVRLWERAHLSVYRGGGGSGTQKSKSLCTKNSPNQYFLL